MITINAGSSFRFLAGLGVDLTGVAGVNFVFEPVTPASADSDGVVLTLDGSGAQTRAATIVNAAGGQVSYTLTSSETLAAGLYRAQFTFNDAQGQAQVFPSSGRIEYQVAEFIAPSSFSALSDFCEPVRAIMGDFRTPFMFEDAAIASVVRTVVRCGHAPGYAITPDALNVSPSVSTPGDLSLIVYHSARALLRPRIRGESWGQRAFRVRRENQRDFLFELENLIYNAENPGQIVSFQSYYSWINSLAGINVWGLMTQMKVNAPVATAVIGTAGIVVNTT